MGIRAGSGVSFSAETEDIVMDTETLFTTPFGRVDFNSDTNDLLIPVLRKEGGVSGDGLANGDKYRTQEENQYPTCEERSFGFDIEAHAFCYCQWNKWRCRQADNL